MNLEIRLAGLFASSAFLIVAIQGYITTENPLHALLYGLGASIVLGFIGFRIGFILAHPRGRKSKKNKKPEPTTTMKATVPEIAPQGTQLTGDEMFLDDLGT